MSAGKKETYQAVFERIEHLVGAPSGAPTDADWTAVMATVVCELHHAFDYYHWTGFYRVVADRLLMIGPYQGGHGCLTIPFDKGVCGAAARSLQTQLVEDVHAIDEHIACSASTNSEIVVPVVTPEDRLVAVLDVDSDYYGAFDEVDQEHLEQICAFLGERMSQHAFHRNASLRV